MGVRESSNTAPLHGCLNPIRRLVPTGPQYRVQSLEYVERREAVTMGWDCDGLQPVGSTQVSWPATVVLFKWTYWNGMRDSASIFHPLDQH